MSLRKLKLLNFTVFSKLDMEFSQGINIFVGENGTGKTHIMKILYAACQSTRKDIIFSQKLVKVFRPDELNISRLVSRGKGGDTAQVEVISTNSVIKTKFTTRTKKWEAETTGEAKWENTNSDLISTFIPAKEILANAYQFEAAYLKDIIDFDETYLDIITAAKIDINRGPNAVGKKKYLEKLKEITLGTVTISDEKFYLKPGTQAKIEFHLVAEGLRKLALLWQLIKNGTLEKGTILFWDEPEANLNPKAIPTLVGILLELQREGVQIFISTHDYVLSKYFEIRSTDNNDIRYFSLFKNKEDSVEFDKCRSFRELRENPIISAYDKLLDEVLDKNMGD
jgi:energy-coupling factor transporter ATP-binding protein EcfA2